MGAVQDEAGSLVLDGFNLLDEARMIGVPDGACIFEQGLTINLSDGGVSRRFLLMNPRTLDALLYIPSMCVFHFSLLLSVTPKYVAESTC